jgi:hypoxanthine phosphoribosyltransferase
MQRGSEPMNQFIGETVLSTDRVREGIGRVADRINGDFSSAVVITVVPGGILVAADLVRQLTFDLEMDYISCPHTPGERDNASPIVYHQNIPITGRDVIVVDDAIESGGTMKRLVAHLQAYEPASLSVATLFVKPGRVSIPVHQYYGYEMDSDQMLVGFGLPWQDRLRNLPYVARLNANGAEAGCASPSGDGASSPQADGPAPARQETGLASSGSS